MSPDILSVSIRALSFVLLFQAIGAAFFVALFGSQLNNARIIGRVILIAAIGGAVTVVIHLMLEATRMTGEFSGLLDTAMQQRVFTSSIAIAHVLQILGLLLIAWACKQKRHQNLVSGIGATMVIVAFLFVGHTSVNPWRIFLVPLLMLHLFIVAFWFGSLLPLWIVSRREPSAVAASVLREFSAIATWLVPLIAIAGLMMVFIIANGMPPLNEPYGQLIVAKLIGFALLMLLAAINKWRLVPAIEAGMVQSQTTLRRAMIMELILIVGVLVVTAVMTTFFSPNE